MELLKILPMSEMPTRVVVFLLTLIFHPKCLPNYSLEIGFWVN
jgi:hypothetical protein